MTKRTIRLSDAQLVILARAAEREDGAASVPARMNRAAAKAGAGLVARKLAREARAKADMPVWRKDAEGRALSLVITRAGREAIGVEEQAPAAATGSKVARGARASAKTAEREAATQGKSTPDRAAAPREGSKQAQLIAMLGDAKGATLDALSTTLGWLPHTTRAAMTGLRKRGLAVERMRGVDGRSVYRIAGGSTSPVAA